MNITMTLLAQVVAFTIMIWLVNKYMWGPINEVLDKRRQKIADGLAAAEKGQQEQEAARQQIDDEIKQAKTQAAEIITQAQKRANEIVEEAKGAATDEAGRVKAAATAEIEQETSRAREDLRKQVSELAVSGAEKILGKEVDAKAHAKALDELAAQI